MDALCQLHPELPRATVSRLRLLQHGARELNDHLEAFFREHGISASCWIPLLILYAHPGPSLNPSYLAASLVQSRTHVTRVVDELVAKHYLERTPDPSDRRRLDLSLTATGRAFIQEMLPRVWARYETLLSVFSETEARTLDVLMRKLLRHLEAGAGEAP